MVRKLQNLLLSSSLLLLLLACSGADDGRVYNRFLSVEGSEWKLGDHKVFSLPRMKDTGKLSLILQLRTDNKYPYTDLTVIAEEKILPSGKTFRHTLRLPVNTDKGTNLYNSELPVNSLLLHKGDSLVVTIYHNMRRENLPGIRDIGLLAK